MEKYFKILFALFLLIFLFSCDSFFFKRKKFESDFKSHTSNADTILYDGDFLHPTYAFIKNGKISGIEFNGNPECGNIIIRYFLNNKEKINKIIAEKDFYSEHCGKPFDSIYVIEPRTKKIKIYTKSTDGKEMINEKLVENYKIDVSSFKQKIKNWNKR